MTIDQRARCLFCELASGRASTVGGPVYQDALVSAAHVFDEDAPTYLGHLYVQTQRHVRSLAEVSDAESQALGLLVARLCRALKECAGAEHAYAEFYAEVTPHVHLLVTARYAGTPPEYWRWHVHDWPQAPRGGRKEVVALAERLRAAVARMAKGTSTAPSASS